MFRKFGAAIALVLGLVSAGAALAQEWPQRQIRIVVITTPGGFPDFTARTLADQLTGILGQQVVVENRPGGGGNIAAAAVANAAPDGYTLLLTGNNHATNVTLVPNPGFDYVKSFAPVSLLAKSNMLLVASPEFKANSVKEVVELAKARPGSVSMAVTQLGTPGHLGAEYLLQATDTDMLLVLYNGMGPALPDLLQGRVDLALSALPAVRSHIESGKLKALAVTRTERSSLLPQLPTIAQAGVPGFDVAGWVCLMAPAGTPPAVVARLNAAIREALAKPEVKVAFDKLALDITPTSPEELAKFMDSETKQWAQVLSKAKLK
jgi:tripartite-type tricarboxylate transporter receptor subunit TctC